MSSPNRGDSVASPSGNVDICDHDDEGDIQAVVPCTYIVARSDSVVSKDQCCRTK